MQSRVRSLYALVTLLTVALVLYAVVEQIYDVNFYVLWESSALLAGDRPYRDFYVIGWPLQTALSAVMQWVVGSRLIGEFLIYWSFILASMLIGFHLALRLSQSAAASLAAILVALLAVASMEWFQSPKLFVYALAVAVGWRYIDRPDTRRAAAAGAATAVAFLLRHDHGVYVGIVFVLAFALARVSVPSSRSAAAMIRDASVYAAVAGLLVVPWVVLVHVHESLPDFVRTRAAWGRVWAPPAGSPYDVLGDIDPRRIVDTTTASGWRLSREQSLIWLVQITLLIPMLALLSVGLDLLVWYWRGRRMRPHACATILAAATSIVAASRLVREESYYVAVLPLSAALGARLLAGHPFEAGTRIWRLAQHTVSAGAVLITAVAAAGYLDRDLLSPNELDELSVTYRQLLSSRAIDAYQPADEAQELDRAAWQTTDSNGRQKIMIRYLHDCTRDGDRLIVTGSTPYQVAYYAQRKIAGGQLQWHHGWRSDTAHEAQSLALLQRQSVPFAFSTHDPVLDDFKAYPRLHAYLTDNYDEIEGSGGLLLVDKRRPPTGRFGRLGFPCFR
ncbi:MAG: hypothetical protein HYU37_17615 [Acidobacteria bacterium]|nr:hypothetical protein [Acidobacteriota bacterium]